MVPHQRQAGRLRHTRQWNLPSNRQQRQNRIHPRTHQLVFARSNCTHQLAFARSQCIDQSGVQGGLLRDGRLALLER